MCSTLSINNFPSHRRNSAKLSPSLEILEIIPCGKLLFCLSFAIRKEAKNTRDAKPFTFLFARRWKQKRRHVRTERICLQSLAGLVTGVATRPASSFPSEKLCTSPFRGLKAPFLLSKVCSDTGYEALHRQLLFLFSPAKRVGEAEQEYVTDPACLSFDTESRIT